MREISLFFESQKVAVITYFEDEYRIHYDKEWIKGGFEISPALSFEKKISSKSIKYFLDNLIPEGQALDDLVLHYRLSKQNLIRITELVGHDAVGAIKFFQDPKENSFREVSDEELTSRLDQRSEVSLLFWDEKPRLSAAGIQDKLTVTILDNKIGFGEGDIASTHILKFQRENNKFKHLVVNELFCMKLAKAIGLNVCEVDLRRFGDHPVLCVKRFDRKVISKDLIKRFHIIDGCQALDLPKTYKYEKSFGKARDVDQIRDGVSFKKLIDFSYKTKVPALTISNILRWMVFNMIVSNFDAHGKNISFFVSTKGIELTPFYDIVCISPYDVDHEMAMGVGEEFELSQIKAFQLFEFCEDNNINKKLLKKIFKDITSKVQKKLNTLDLPNLSVEEATFVENIKSIINNQISTLDTIWPDIDKF